MASSRRVARPLVAGSRRGAACSRGAGGGRFGGRVVGRGGAGHLSFGRSSARHREPLQPGQSSRSGHSSSFLLVSAANRS